MTALATVTPAAPAAEARDQMHIVGSSTVFPFTEAVAEQLGKATKFKTPIVESTGTGGGFKLFCAGVGEQHPDMTNASRAIREGELADCKKNGVNSVTEVKIGFDGIVIANSRAMPRSSITKEQIFLALAKTVPQNGKLVANPYTTWNQIDAKLPAKKIEVFGPPPTSGTRDAFVELVMDEACEKFAKIKALEATDAKQHVGICESMREDGPFIEAGENDNLIVQKLVADKDAYGIFGFSFLDQNADKIQGSNVGGAEPTFANIASGKYGVSRPLFFYVKNQHVGVVPGMKEFLSEFTSDKAFGKEGYLSSMGLIALPDAERQQVRSSAMNLRPLNM